jgi:DNA-nicking Smr family endonuclease
MSSKRRKKTHLPNRPSPRKVSTHGFYTPFRDLDQHLRVQSKSYTESVAVEKKSLPAPQGSDDSAIFISAMSDVTPLSQTQRARVPSSPPTKVAPHFLQQEELEVYAHLVDLVNGDGPFELTYSDEYVDGAVVGLSPQILKKLREGEFSYQDCLDLHGFNRWEANDLVIKYVSESFVQKLRCVLIVCGRGLNSRNREPVLKQNLATWLTRAPLKSLVLAFASARSWDGGAGAFYVLLRRNKGKAPFVSPAS